MKSPKSLSKKFDKAVGYITLGLIPRYVATVVWILRIDNPTPFYILGDKIKNLIKLSGRSYATIYLKESLRITCKFLAGQKESNTLDDLRLGLTFGLPRWIPRELRHHLRSRNRKEIKATLTILSIFRIIKSDPKLKIETITAPYKGKDNPFSSWEIYSFARDILPRMKVCKSRFICSLSAGPNSNPSALGLSLDAIALNEARHLLYAMKTLAYRFNGLEILAALLQEIEILKRTPLIHSEVSNPILSKLSFKEEAAGKVRVFAIVDGWTQSLLSGLHDSLSSILSNIEQDGTFDQAKPLRSLMQSEPKMLYSFDLSAATDRLPVFIQEELLSYLFNKEVSSAWRTLLVDRPYHISPDKRFPNLPPWIRYEVGQPMGALSSFNMLGLTHHMIVQIAAKRAGCIGWFDAYALLGDDIVIADTKVASAYSNIMSDLGMDINPHKTLVSNEICEFAKRLVSIDSEYTPIGPKHILQFIKSWKHTLDLIDEVIQKGEHYTLGDIETLISSIPWTFLKGSRRLKSRLLRILQGPFSSLSLGVRIAPDLIPMANSFNPMWLGNALAKIRYTLHKVWYNEWEVAMTKLNKILWDLELDQSWIPGFSQLPDFELFEGVDFDKRYYLIQWKTLPSFHLIKGKYQEAYNNLLFKKPILDYQGLFRVDMTQRLLLRDILTMEYTKPSPTFASLSSLFDKEDVKENFCSPDQFLITFRKTYIANADNMRHNLLEPKFQGPGAAATGSSSIWTFE